MAHGLFSETEWKPVEQRIDALLAREQAVLAGYYFCPHHPNGNVFEYAISCGCREPQPDLIQTRGARSR